MEMPALFLFEFEIANKKTINCFSKGVILNPKPTPRTTSD
jgi:hypothetical protein